MDRAVEQDADSLARAFASWPKPPELFRNYLRRQASGEIGLLIARVGEEVAGYCVVEWDSTYPPFAERGVPEIVDLNVVAGQRRRGAGLLLLTEAEALVAQRSTVAGLRVGLYIDYGAAQRMYVRHGYVPDGRGVSVHGRVVEPGATIRIDDDAVLAFTRAVS